MDNTRPPEDADRLFSIRIEGLTNDANKDDLNRVFESYGKIGDIYIPRNTREGGNRGFGFVRYYQREDAEAALRENGQSLHGATIQVTMAEARPPRRERRSRSRSYGHSRRYSRSRSGHRGYRSRSRSHSRRRYRSPSRSRDRSRYSSGRDRRSPSGGRSMSGSRNRSRSMGSRS